MKEKCQISVTLSREQGEMLRQLAEEACRIRSGYIRKMITAHLDDIAQNPEHKFT